MNLSFMIGNTRAYKKCISKIINGGYYGIRKLKAI
jgi:hypothetical protein